MIRTMIIDDEPLAREGIRLRLLKESDIDIVAEAETGRKAITAILEHQPDLVFLDVQMPGMNGFEVLKQIDPQQWPLVIFVTAYDQYALNAFEVHALDYLLKPVDNERFQQSLKRARQQLQHVRMGQFGSKIQHLLNEIDVPQSKSYQEKQIKNIEDASGLERIAIKTLGTVHFIQVNEIEWIEAAGDYVYIHTNGKKHLIRERLSHFEKQLPANLFRRVHRSTIVNLNKIRELRKSDHGEYIIYLQDNTTLKASRSYRQNLQQMIGF